MKTEIELDLYADVEPEGIVRSVYFGEACEPALESRESWQEIVERNVGYYIRPNEGTISSADLKQLEKTVAGMENAVALLRAKMQELAEKE